MKKLLQVKRKRKEDGGEKSRKQVSSKSVFSLRDRCRCELGIRESPSIVRLTAQKWSTWVIVRGKLRLLVSRTFSCQIIEKKLNTCKLIIISDDDRAFTYNYCLIHLPFAWQRLALAISWKHLGDLPIRRSDKPSFSGSLHRSKQELGTCAWKNQNIKPFPSQLNTKLSFNICICEMSRPRPQA